ncbi:MAG: hypothetical protein ACK54K_15115 [Gemmatimonadaceae bacterium]
MTARWVAGLQELISSCYKPVRKDDEVHPPGSPRRRVADRDDIRSRKGCAADGLGNRLCVGIPGLLNGVEQRRKAHERLFIDTELDAHVVVTQIEDSVEFPPNQEGDHIGVRHPKHRMAFTLRALLEFGKGGAHPVGNVIRIAHPLWDVPRLGQVRPPRPERIGRCP